MRRVDEAKLPTIHGEFTAVAYESLLDNKGHIALVMGDLSKAEAAWYGCIRNA